MPAPEPKGQSFLSAIVSILIFLALSTVILALFLVPFSLVLSLSGVLVLSPQTSLATISYWLNRLSPYIIFFTAFAQTLAYLVVAHLRYLRPFKIKLSDMGIRFENLRSQIMTGLVLWVLLEASALLYDFALVKVGLSAGGPGTYSYLSTLGVISLSPIVFSQAILGPIGEEIFFRGYIFTTLSERYSLWGGALLSSLVFALLHGINWNLPLIFIHGLLYAYFLHKSKSLMAVVAGHSLKNATTLAFHVFAVKWY